MSRLKRQFCKGRFRSCVRRATVLTVCWTIALELSAGSAQEPARSRDDKQEPKRESKVGKRLIREVTEAGESDMMDEIMRMMSDVGRRLDIEFDSGAETQDAQREIVKRLNDAILLAAKQRRRNQRSVSASRDRRSRPDQRRAKEQEVGQQQGGTEASAGSEAAVQTQDPTSANAKAGDLRDTRRTWGNLPQRERDEVIQGSEEAHLERFRAWIERYYRALQENEE